jgi:hypothetical protein
VSSLRVSSEEENKTLAHKIIMGRCGCGTSDAVSGFGYAWEWPVFLGLNYDNEEPVEKVGALGLVLKDKNRVEIPIWNTGVDSQAKPLNYTQNSEIHWSFQKHVNYVIPVPLRFVKGKASAWKNFDNAMFIGDMIPGASEIKDGIYEIYQVVHVNPAKIDMSKEISVFVQIDTHNATIEEVKINGEARIKNTNTTDGYIHASNIFKVKKNLFPISITWKSQINQVFWSLHGERE